MVNWRKHLWVKAAILTIAGVFLFSQVTWAARAQFNLSSPQIPLNSNQDSLLGNIWQQISSFFLPNAYAEELMSGSIGGAGYVLPALDLDIQENTENDTVILEDDTVNVEKIANNEEIWEDIFKALGVNKQTAAGDIPYPVEGEDDFALPADGEQILEFLSALAIDPTIITYYNNKTGFISLKQTELPEENDSIILHNNDPPKLTYNCAFQSLSQLLPDVAADILAAELAYYTKDNQTSLYGIQQVAARHGLTLNGVEFSFEQLKDLGGQTICHLNLGNGQYHYVVVMEVTDNNRVIYIDNGIRTTASLKEFEAMATGYALTIAQTGIGRTLNREQMEVISGASYRLSRYMKMQLWLRRNPGKTHADYRAAERYWDKRRPKIRNGGKTIIIVSVNVS